MKITPPETGSQPSLGATGIGGTTAVPVAGDIPIAGGYFGASTVEEALGAIAAELARLAGTGETRYWPMLALTSGPVAATGAHVNDATDAHDASAISFVPNGSIAATDVQAAIQEVRDEAGSGGITVQDEGTPLATAGTTLNFAGAGVTATGAGASKLITIPGGGGSSSILYGGLKPATPLDDFAASTLNAAWSAHSSQGAFATTDCFTQALDGSHLSMGFQAKNGRIYRAATDVDQEWLAGGIIPDGEILTGTQPMFSIALVNTLGTGVCIVVYNDGNAYLASMTTWDYGAFTGTFTGYGHNLLRHGPYALRLARVGNVFTGYISIDGQTWVTASATLTTAFTVAHKSIGMAYNPAIAYKARLFVDWVHTA